MAERVTWMDLNDALTVGFSPPLDDVELAAEELEELLLELEELEDDELLDELELDDELEDDELEDDVDDELEDVEELDEDELELDDDDELDVGVGFGVSVLLGEDESPPLLQAPSTVARLIANIKLNLFIKLILFSRPSQLVVDVKMRSVNVEYDWCG